MITGEEMLEELIKIEPSRLDENTQKLFYTIMKVIDERDELQDKISKSIEIIESYNLGKYDYSVPSVGIIELLEILGGKNE